MNALRNVSLSAFRWVFLAALLFAAMNYLFSGLSESPRPAVSDETNAVSLANASTSLSADLDEQVAAINQARTARLDKLDLPSAEAADWQTICRRMSLALVGTGLSLEEIRSLERLPVAERESRHLQNLLRDSRFHNYWAERYTRFLVGTEEGPFLVYRRRRFRLWLADQFATNRRYDALVRHLLTAEGLWTDKPEVNFYTVTYDSGDDGPDPIRLAARASRVFLGLRIDCLQCHDDFLGNVSLGDVDDPRGGMQSDFHQLAAFFTAAQANGIQGVREGDVDYQFKYLHADEEVDVPAEVPYQPELLPGKGGPRARLANWVTSPKNRQAARSAVSHVWALLFGRARGESVDSLPLDEPMDAEMSLLVDDFVEHGYDLRRLIRLITATDEFRVDSRADFHVTTRHDMAGSVFPLVRLRPEQIAGAVIQSSRIRTIDRDSSFLVQLQTFGGTNDFVRRYGDIGEDEFKSDNLTISQRLVMLNGKLVDESIDDNPFLSASSHLRMFSSDDESVVENAYLCVLNRHPTTAEATHFRQRLDEAEKREHAVEDLFWTLLNSSEFAWNH